MSINEQVARAIAMSGFDWIVNIANEKKAENRSDTDLKDIAGIDANDTVTNEDRAKLAIVDGTASESYAILGGMIFSQLEFRLLK